MRLENVCAYQATFAKCLKSEISGYTDVDVREIEIAKFGLYAI